MGSIDRRAREKNETREKILAAARDLFVREGFEAVSMRKIAEAIEYTPAAIYTHFADKHALMLALCDADFGLLREAMGDATHHADPVERLRRCGRAYIDFGFAHPHHYRFMFMTKFPPYDPSESPCEHGNPDEDAYAFLLETVRACIDQERFLPECRDADVVTQVCWGAVHGIVSLYLTHGDDPWVNFVRPRESAEMLYGACVNGLLRMETTPAQGVSR